MSTPIVVDPTAAPTRRKLLLAGAGLALSAVLSRKPSHGAATAGVRLSAAPADLSMVRRGGPRTAVWAYNGSVPGPALRVRQGEALRILVENGLGEATTVHWHGIRLPIAMDGVPGISQPPIA